MKSEEAPPGDLLENVNGGLLVGVHLVYLPEDVPEVLLAADELDDDLVLLGDLPYLAVVGMGALHGLPRTLLRYQGEAPAVSRIDGLADAVDRIK